MTTRKSHALADRMRHIDASGIRKVFDLASNLKDPVDLSIGQPDFDVPEQAKQAAIDAIRRGENRYTQTQGAPALRRALAELGRKEFGWADDRPYLVTSGVSGALMLAFLAIVNPGDEIIMPEPYFAMYSQLAHLVGGVLVPVPTYPRFRPDIQRFADAVTDKTRVILINSPCNPTGAVWTKRELGDLAAVARKRDLLVFSDEIYNLFCYDEPFVSMAGLYENTLLMRGWGKTYGMTGWRMGWCTGPSEIIDKMGTLQQWSFVCAPSVSQAGALAAMECDMSAQVAAYRKKRDLVYDALGPALGLVKPQGAFYAFCPAPEEMTGSAFCVKAIENNVLVIPGNVFSSQDTHFRISYATSDEKLARGMEILTRLAK
jgi:aspartate aminotransferase/aminotransferase